MVSALGVFYCYFYEYKYLSERQYEFERELPVL